MITRQDEANFPDFNSIDEARAYFKERYGDKYVEGNRVYYEGYVEFGEYIFFDEVNGQSVEIGENGNVHVIY